MFYSFRIAIHDRHYNVDEISYTVDSRKQIVTVDYESVDVINRYGFLKRISAKG